MEINGTPPTQLTVRQTLSTISAWKVGQIFQAVVVKQTSPQTVILQVNQQQLQAETSVPLAAGQRLELSVAQLGEKPVLQARLMAPQTSAQTQSQTSAQTPATAPSTTQTLRTAATPTTPPTAHAPAAPQTQSTSVQTQTNSLMKLALPKQASMTALLANIAWLNNPATQLPALPSPVLMIIKQLYNNLPTKEKLTNSAEIKQGVLNSGIFMENKLQKIAKEKGGEKANQLLQQTFQTTPSTAKAGTDLKSALLRLLSAIQNTKQATPIQGQHTPALPQSLAPAALPFTPPTLRGNAPQPQQKMDASLPAAVGNLQLLLLELGKQSEASLARTQLHQAASLSGTEQSNTNLAFELPIRNNQQIDLFDIVIEEEKPNQHDDEERGHAWSISLAFDLEGLGPLHAKLRLVENKVSTLFWAEREETTQLLNQHIANLTQRYQQSGLEAAELQCFNGPPPSAPSAMPHIVLDVKA